ncbi:hypothetical protein BAUCODRAFT_569073 [Baudoinia panamericana UAMH 10762]|uniref:Glucose-methanol-choline oxidoreductase N-terminal domain-containing protein n=1 Tax=Baudoinia panamericana (strain UAMH 10762) TaxID=717646 RepID=M2N1R5_BAUPA|nr:uncharacterized protein BAUCODRAFT_569073 [Baudoinia panamericana UAMH 10762]EMC92904.1 hypothetical protein BAUCODRAFT_569073 [Baudoinia panamericana UAMH 10762]
MVALRQLILSALASFSSAQHSPLGSAFGIPGNASYDYVVIGGGTAGLTIATRLAQGGHTVSVIEAGGFYEVENGNRSVVPGLLGLPSSPGADGRSIPYTRGKCLGGSSARNALGYLRPTIGTMQRWADVVGDPSFVWNNTIKYFKKSTGFTPPRPGEERPANSTATDYDLSAFSPNGPVQVSFPAFTFALGSWILAAADALGLPRLPQGLESGRLLGHTWVPVTIDAENRERSTSETAYLALGEKTQRLTVFTHTMAKQIIFHGTTATGVRAEAAGVPFVLSANKEVILSAGAFQSPQLLMVSGVGPADTLIQFDIHVIANRSGVGQNMWDNPLFAVSYAFDFQTSSAYQNNPTLFAEAVEQYNANRSGFLTNPGDDVVSFEKLLNVSSANFSAKAQRDLADFPADWPDVLLASTPVYAGPGLAPDTVNNYGSFVIGLEAPLSRGYVTINSSDASIPPIINPQWLTHPTDQEVAIAAVRRIRQYAATPQLQSVILGGKEVFPGLNVTSDEDILAAIRSGLGTYYHASVTCRMGMANDSMAVVDSKGRVIGVNALRVVDVSAMPFLPPGLPQAVVYMLAEKQAEDILTGSS